jgi:hypothetical protein
MSVRIKSAQHAPGTPVGTAQPASEGTPLPPAPAAETFFSAEPPSVSPRARKKPAKPKQRTKARRPHQYDPAVIDAVLKAVAGGKTLSEACRSDPAFPTRATVYGWISADPELKARYDTAREFQLEFWADQLIDIPDAIQIGDYMGKLPDGTVVKLKTADKIKKASLQVEYRFKVLSRRSQDYTERATITHSGSVNGVRHVVISGALPDEPLGDYSDADAEKLLVDTARNYEFKPAYPGGNPRRVGGKYGDFAVTGGLPRVPLGELPEAERAAAVAAARKTRVITQESINNPFNLDIAAIEASDAYQEARQRRQAGEVEAAERGPSPGDLAVMVGLSGNPADYDGDA